MTTNALASDAFVSCMCFGQVFFFCFFLGGGFSVMLEIYLRSLNK